jgi:hypothetical protein
VKMVFFFKINYFCHAVFVEVIQMKAKLRGLKLIGVTVIIVLILVSSSGYLPQFVGWERVFSRVWPLHFLLFVAIVVDDDYDDEKW